MTHHLPLIRSLLKQNLLTWVIGHEIGHALQHQRLLRERHGIPDLDAIEREADAFVARSVLRDPALGNQFFVVLGEVLQQEYRRDYIDQHILAGTRALADRRLPAKVVLRLQSSPGNVPLLLRGLRLAEVSMAVDPAVKTRAYLGKIGGRIVSIQPLNDDFATFLASRVSVVPAHRAVTITSDFARTVMATGILSAIAATAIVLLKSRRPE